MSDQPSSQFTFDASQETPQNTLNTPADTSFIYSDVFYSGTYTSFNPTEFSQSYEKVKLIWGTTININETIDQFKEILSQYYSDDVRCMIETESSHLKIKNLHELTDNFIAYPTELIPLLKKGLNDFILEINPRYCKETDISFQVLTDIPLISFRTINVNYIDKIVSTRGIILRVSQTRPELVRACFVCTACSSSIMVDKIKNTIKEPVNCPCGVNFNFEISNEKSVWIDKQILRIQEFSNSDPLTFTIVVYNELINKVVPGDKVTIMGILRANVVMGFNKANNVFRGTIEGLAIAHDSKNQNIIFNNEKENIENREIQIIDEEKELIEDNLDNLADNEKRYEILSSLIAPSVYGHKDVKKAILLMMVGGITKHNLNATLRGNINILLAGDPGVAKSQILSFVNKNSKGIYTSGSGSSAAGLSASVSRDPDTGTFVLESGALNLSDGGICIIDEFDKMNYNAQGVLHEAMEQQTISIAKAGIINTLNARCSILASCNPKESVWNRNKSIRENLSIVPTLLSRFDLIFILLDGNDPVIDNSMADFILKMYSSNPENISTKKIDLKKEIEKSQKIIPKISSEAAYEIEEAYVMLRSKSSRNVISATTRQLEAIIRLSEAHARIRLSMSVDVVDVREALRLIKESMLMYAVDPITGKIDIDLIGGRSARERAELENIKEIITRELKKRKKMIIEDIENQWGHIAVTAVQELLDEELLAQEGDVIIHIE